MDVVPPPWARKARFACDANPRSATQASRRRFQPPRSSLIRRVIFWPGVFGKGGLRFSGANNHVGIEVLDTSLILLVGLLDRAEIIGYVS